VLHHVTGHAVFATFVTDKSAVGIIIVVTLEVLSPVFASIVSDVIVPVFVIVPHVAITVHEMITIHVELGCISQSFTMIIPPEMLPADVVIHVNHAGKMSVTIVATAVFHQKFV
jgi:membrane glycosyltransferase